MSKNMNDVAIELFQSRVSAYWNTSTGSSEKWRSYPAEDVAERWMNECKILARGAFSSLEKPIKEKDSTKIIDLEN